MGLQPPDEEDAEHRAHHAVQQQQLVPDVPHRVGVEHAKHVEKAEKGPSVCLKN